MDVMLIEDHAVLRQGLKSLLETACGARVVCDVGTAEEALESLEATAPNLVILDLSLPGKDGIWAIRRIKQLRPETPVLVLSMHTDEEVVTRAMRAGADAYVIKSAAYSDLAEAIEAVRQGRRYLHPDLSGARSRCPEPPAETPLPPLSQVEREVLRLLGQGVEEAEIGQVLGMPASAVPRVVQSLAERCGCQDVADLRHLGLRLDS